MSYHRKLAYFFRYLRIKGLIPDDPTLWIERPRIPKRIPRRLNAEEAEKLMMAARKSRSEGAFTAIRNTAMVATMLFTGLRRMEMVNLQLCDVDIGGPEVSLTRSPGKEAMLIRVNQ